MNDGLIRIHWAIIMGVISFGLLTVLALLGCTDRFSAHHLETLAAEAEVERLGIADFQRVSDGDLTDQLAGTLYEYQTAQEPRLLWVSADGSAAHVLGTGAISREFLTTDLNGDGEEEFIFVEDHGSGLYVERVVGYTIGEWDAPTLAAYVSHGTQAIKLELVGETRRLEVRCDDELLGWFAPRAGSGALTYETPDEVMASCRR
jgi:hypothetical protein